MKDFWGSLITLRSVAALRREGRILQAKASLHRPPRLSIKNPLTEALGVKVMEDTERESWIGAVKYKPGSGERTLDVDGRGRGLWKEILVTEGRIGPRGSPPPRVRLSLRPWRAEELAYLLLAAALEEPLVYDGSGELERFRLLMQSAFREYEASRIPRDGSRRP